MTESKKGFKSGLYGVIAGVLVAAILVGLTVFAFTTRYNAFSPEKVAQSYAIPLFKQVTDTMHSRFRWYQKIKSSATL